MVQVFLKIIVTAILVAVAWVSLLFFLGAIEKSQRGISFPILVCSLAFGTACLWGIVRIWRTERQQESAAIDIRGDEQMTGIQDEAAFNQWLAAKIVDATAMPPETLADFRRRFEEERSR